MLREINGRLIYISSKGKFYDVDNYNVEQIKKIIKKIEAGIIP